MNYLGCSGWHYEDWKDRVYRGEPKSKWFQIYASKFNTVEVNSTFYHFPKQKTVNAWKDQAPDGFVYSVKANRGITHTKKFKGTKRLVRDFYKTAGKLKGHLGCVLFQLHPVLRFDMNKLREILSQIDCRRKNVIEFRHSSWWNEKVYSVLKKKKVIFCIVSAPGLPDDFIKTANDIYIRFHGKKRWYKDKYSDKELKEIAKKIKNANAKNSWVYFNNDYDANAVRNCLKLKKLLAH